MIRSVLIVEDDALIASDIDAFLEAAGYVVVGVAGDMHLALALAARFKPDAATMDVELARGTSGVETARRLFEEHGARSLFVSARITPMMRQSASASRPIGFVSKPYDEDAIVKALRAA